MKYLSVCAMFFLSSCSIDNPKAVTIRINDIIWNNGIISGKFGEKHATHTEYAHTMNEGQIIFQYSDTSFDKELFFKVYEFKDYLFAECSDSKQIKYGWAKANEKIINEVWPRATITFIPPKNNEPVTDFTINLNTKLEWIEYSDVPDSLKTEYGFNGIK